MWSYNYTALPDEFYHYDKQSDELYHYGVLGMRWGHRKAEYYDKRAAVNRAKVEKRKSSIGKSIAENRSSTNKFYADRRRAIKSAKGLRKFGEAGDTQILQEDLVPSQP